MLSAHYFYILSCSVYVSRGLINYNLLHKQEGKKPTLYIYTLLYFLSFLGGGGELTFLSISRAGCFVFLCKHLGMLRHPCSSVSLISLSLCSGQGFNLKDKVEPLLSAPQPVPARGWQGRHGPCCPQTLSRGTNCCCFLQGHTGSVGGSRTSSDPSVHPEGSSSAQLCSVYPAQGVFCVYEVTCPCPPWQNPHKFQLIEWGL